MEARGGGGGGGGGSSSSSGGRMVMKKYTREVSPERSKVWREKSPKYNSSYKSTPIVLSSPPPTPPHHHLLSSRRVPVVYYLCRNRQLEHPHFMEVPLSSTDGLFLRDVIERLNALRGRGMASLYSWSSKRSYKNGFVWHDLSEDDLILPAHANEYVLKGSELFGDLSLERFATVGTVKIQSLKQLPEPPHASSSSLDDSSSSSSMNGKETKSSQEDDLSSPASRHPGSAGTSPESRVANGKNSLWNGSSLSLTEYKVYKDDGLANASTQTEEVMSRHASKETCTRGVSTDEGILEVETGNECQARAVRFKENQEISGNSVSSPPSTSSVTSSSGGRTETLESLIRADVNKINSFRIFEEEEVRMPNNARFKATNVLMQLISCGSISVKDHSFGFTPTYKPRFSHSKFSSPLFSSSLMLRELDCLAENPRITGPRLEEKEYFSGSLIETKMPKEGDGITLKRSSSYNADRSCKQLDSTDNDESTSGHSKCIPLSLKASLSKHPRCESMRSPLSDKPRNSSDGADGSASECGSRTITDSPSGRKLSKKLESFTQEETVIKIEERLASGARVVIQSKSPCEAAACSSLEKHVCR